MAPEGAVRAMLADGALDLVVRNDLAQRGAMVAFPAQVWAVGKPVGRCDDRAAVWPALERRLLARDD